MFTFLLKSIGCLPAETDSPAPTRRLADAFPNVPLTDQFGRHFHFRDDFVEKNKTLVINTMYTTCRGSCPGTSATIESLRQELSEVFGKRITFLSFTLEPLIDTPAKLLNYAKMYGAGERKSELCDWQFLSALPKDWEQLRRSLGFFELDARADSDITQHASILLVGNLTKNRWCRLPSELRKPVLLDSIRRIAGNTIEEQYGVES